MSKYALVHEGIVVNIILDKPDGRYFEPGLQWVEIKDGVDCKEGYQYDEISGRFSKIRLSLEQEKLMLLEKVNNHADFLHDRIIQGYPKSEVSTFYRQELEVERWTRGDHRVPFLAYIAKRRKLPIEEIMARVAYKAELIAPIIAVPCADRQFFEDEIMACKTMEQLDGVIISVDKWMRGEGISE